MGLKDLSLWNEGDWIAAIALVVLIGFLAQGPAQGTPGLFGPVVPIADGDEAPLLDQAVALAGRDPHWR